MKDRNKTRLPAFAVALAVLALGLSAMPALAQEHGGPLTNTHNDLVIVEGDSENPDGLRAGHGSVLVRENISFANDDIFLVTDYGIVWIPPEFDIEVTYTRVLAYEWTFNVANYTLVLRNETDGFEGNIAGIEDDEVRLDPGDLGPDDPAAPHPRANATYRWSVVVINNLGRPIMSVEGGNVTTVVNETTVIDLAPLDLPPLGFNNLVADEGELTEMSRIIILEPHPSLKEGFYRVRIGDTVFEYGVAFAIEVRYRTAMVDDRVAFDKLLFTPRTVHVDIYHGADMEVVVYDAIGGQGARVPPTHVSTGPGVPTSFTPISSFSVVIQEEREEGTDWGLYGRYAALATMIIVLLALLLWSGPRRGGEDGEEGPEGEAEEPEEGEDAEENELAARMEELEKEKQTVLEAIKELDRRHKDGELGEGVWKRKRSSLKSRAVHLMKELKVLEGERG